MRGNRGERGGRFDRGGGGRGPRRSDRGRSRSRSPRSGAGTRRSFGGSGHDRDKNDRMVYLTNLSYDVRWVELKTLVQDKGGEVKFIEILQDREGKSKGCAIAEFHTREAAQLCCKNLDRYEHMGRNLVVKEIRDPVAFMRKVQEETGVDFLGTGGGSVRTAPAELDRAPRQQNYELYGLSPEFLRKYHIEPPLVDRVFIANLTITASTGKVYDVFGLAGKIVWMDLHVDKESRLKGTGVIQFSHPIEAVQAISMFNGQRLFDRALVVKMDKFDKPERPSNEGGLPRGLESMGMGLGADGAPLKDVASVVSQMTSRTSSIAPSSQTFGSSYGANDFGAPRSGFEAASYERSGPLDRPLDRPVGLNNFDVGGPSPFGASLGVTPSYSSTTYDLKSSVIGNFRSSATSTVLIKNLPPDYTWQIVRDRVQQFGDTDGVDMIAPGCARIRFRIPSDADRMRSALAGTTVEGRPISVEFV